MASLLKNAKLLSSERVDLRLRGGRIEAISTGLSSQPGETVFGLAGRVIVPGFVDAHVHLDKTLSLGENLENTSGTLLEAIELWQAAKPGFDRENYLARARRAVAMAVSHGTTAMRTHVDVDENGLTALETLLELRGEVRDKLELQIVALGSAGGSAKEAEMMAEALRLGADFVGGAPALSPEPYQAVRASLDLAERLDKPVDLHIDETDDPGMRTLGLLAEEVIARGLQGRVTAGHCVSLMAMSEDQATSIAVKVAEAEIDVVSLPAVNLILQGRGDTKAVRRGVTRIKMLLEAGVNVSVASDNVRDPFNPFGNYDLLWLANLSGHVAQLTGSEERDTLWQLVGVNPARTLGLDYGVKPGCAADLVVLASRDPADCLASLPSKQAVLKSGAVVYGELEPAKEVPA